MCAELSAPGERRSVRYRSRWPGGSEGTSEASRVRVLAAPGFSQCNTWAAGDIPAPGRQRGVAGRKPLSWLHLRLRRATFCGPQKEDRDRSGVLTRIDLKSLIPRLRFLDPSAWRASGRGALRAPPILRSGLGALALRLWRWDLAAPPAPSGCCRDSPSSVPCLRASRSGLRLRVQPSGSGGQKVRTVVPPCPAPRLAPPNRSLCGPPSRGLLLPPSPSASRLWGYFVARLVGSYDEAPEASADEALQLPIGLPLLPGNFRTVRFPEAASLDLAPRGFRLLAPPPGKPSANGSHSPAGASCRQGRLGLRLGVPGAKWLLPPSPAFES